MKVNSFKARKLFQEFPFLEAAIGSHEAGGNRLLNWVSHGYAPTVTIKRADVDLLNKKPSQYYWDGSCGDTERTLSFVFVSKDGEMLQEQARPDYVSGSNYAHSATTRRDGETLAEVIDRSGIADFIGWIVSILIDSYNWDRSYETRSIVIYKLPKSKGGISGLIDAIQQEEGQYVLDAINQL